MLSRTLALALLLLPTLAPAKWDFTAHYHKRRAEISRQIAGLPPETTSTVVLLGDSITEGHPARTVAGLPVVNQGIGGDRTDMPTSGTGVRRRLDLVREARPAHVFLMIGINDFWGGGETADQVKPRYEELVRALLAEVPNARLHLVSVLPTSGRNASMNREVVPMNDFIRGLARTHKLEYLDLHALMSDEKGELREEFTGDGVHLTPPAYAAWTAALEKHLSK